MHVYGVDAKTMKASKIISVYVDAALNYFGMPKPNHAISVDHIKL